jgi:seryl-tRNA synthetase
MLDIHTREHGYNEVLFLSRQCQSLQGTGQLPKFKEDLLRFREGNLFRLQRFLRTRDIKEFTK